MFTVSCYVVKFANIDTDFVLCLAHVPERPDVQRVLVMKFARIDHLVGLCPNCARGQG